MKPRLRLKGGVWSCASYVMVAHPILLMELRIGYGYTAQEAWKDWEKQQ